MKKLNIAFAILLSAAAFTGCRSNKDVHQSYTYTNLDPVCIRSGHDGTETLRVWGKGATQSEAVEQALKNAVRAVLFQGIPGTGECEKRPLVTEVNAEERYRDYFTRLFATGGEYKKFATEASKTDGSRQVAETAGTKAYGIICIVNREALRQQLLADGVLAQ